MKRELFLIKVVILFCVMTICVLADPPANDDCVNADDAGTLVSGSTVQLTGTTVDATQDCGYNSNSEVWVKFTLAGCMDVTIDFCDDPSIVTEWSYVLYDGCPCDNSTTFDYAEVCGSSSNYSRTWHSMEAGTYYYSILQPHRSPGPYTVNVTGIDCPDAPVNDNCGNAISIGEVTDYSFSTRSATYDGNGTCITSGANVWFVYTASNTFSARISLDGSHYNTMMAVYNGTDCSHLPTRLGCTASDHLDISVVSGQSYLIEIGGVNDAEGYGLLTISEAPVTPANDDCADADDAGTLLDGVTVQLTGDTDGATTDCMNHHDPEVWISFTLSSCMNVTIDFCDDANTVSNPSMNLFGECPCADMVFYNSQVNCPHGSNLSTSWNNLAAGDYYYPIFSNGNPYTVNITGVNCTPPIGACCMNGGMTCTGDTEEDYCVNTLRGTWMGEGSTCGDYDEHSGWSGCQTPELGACCINGGMNCTESTTEDYCVNTLRGTWMEDGSTCGTYDHETGWSGCSVQPELGACCMNGGMTCTGDIEEDYCVNTLRGTWMGEGSTCGDYDEHSGWSGCQTPELGACCMNGGMTCTGDTEEDYCVNTLRGTWMGEGSTCGDYDEHSGWSGCQTPELGACCMNGGMTCTGDTEEDYCVNTLRGTWMGEGSTCGDYDEHSGWSGCQTPELGACCMNGGMTCTGDTEEDYCVNTLRGTWMGEGSTCGDYDEHSGWSGCQTPELGACCINGGMNCNESTTEDYCVNTLRGTWMEDGSTCGTYDHETGWSGCSVTTTYEYLPGDANMAAGSWPPNVIGADVTYLVNYFRAIAAPCLVGGFYNSADANGDCSVIGADVTYLVQYFRGANELHYCPDYEPTWQNSGDLPAEAPDGWPNCE